MAYKKMVPEIKKKWVEALRSGEYKQTKGALCQDDRYCCLGVLAKINGDLNTEHSYGFVTDNGKQSEEMLLLPQFKKYGMTETVGTKLASFNDDQGKTFPEIATWVNKNL